MIPAKMVSVRSAEKFECISINENWEEDHEFYCDF